MADIQMWQKPKWAGWRQPIAVRIEIFLSHDIYRVFFLTGSPDFQYQNEKQVADEKKWKQGEERTKAWDQNESEVDADFAKI